MNYQEKRQELESLLEAVSNRIANSEEAHSKARARYGRRANTYGLRPSQGLYQERKRLEQELQGLDYTHGEMIDPVEPMSPEKLT